MQPNPIYATASEELETPPPDKIGNKAGSDSRASDAGVHFYRDAEKGTFKSPTVPSTTPSHFKTDQIVVEMAYSVASHSLREYEQHLRKKETKSKTGEDIEALSRHCIKCGLTGCWEGRSSVPLLMQARVRRCCGSREEEKRWGFCNMDPCIRTCTTAGKSSPCCWQ